jgi:D-alanyl-D-alanine carboxypeptidase/D-alanyl-D-alanine-endopeptidase (penicillin-binding protein 4)
MSRVLAAFAALSVCAGVPATAVAVDRGLGAAIAKPAVGGVPWSRAAVVRLDRDIDTLLQTAPTLRGAHVGLLVLDTRTGDVLYARNSDDAFVPASTLKLLTGSTALAVLGPAFRFRTQASVDARNNELEIEPGGDPLLNAGDLTLMAQGVRAAGVTTLPLGLRVDSGAFEAAPYPPGWSWDDFPYDYAPVLSAATIEENVVHLTVSPGRTVGAPVTVSVAPAPFALTPDASAGCPFTPAIDIRARAVTGSPGGSASLDLARDPGGCIEIVGSVPQGNVPQILDAAVPNPVWYLRALAAAALGTAGVTVAPIASSMPPALPVPGRLVWSHDGEPLTDLLGDMWQPSDNLIAEALLREIGIAHAGKPGTIDAGTDAERAWLRGIGIDPQTVTIADGSGLSSYDRITPRALAAILQSDWNGPHRDVVLDDLPLAGVRGTLATSFDGSLAQDRTFAKTGSVNHARGLAGYLATLHHGALTFAWSLDDWMGTDDDLRDLRARVLSRLIGD